MLRRNSSASTDVVYHYTNAGALLSIIEKQELRVTHWRYLNDRSEASHALKIADEELVKLCAEPGQSAETLQLLLALREPGGENSNFGQFAQPGHVCICSFSAEGDLLSQWRAYGSYAIGFSRAALKQKLKFLEWPATLRKCTYNEATQRQQIRTQLSKSVQDIQKIPLEKRELQPSYAGLYRWNHEALVFKNEHFREEKEWRLICGPISPFNLLHREGRSGITPYSTLGFDHSAVKEIVVGPEGKVDSLVSFLCVQGYQVQLENPARTVGVGPTVMVRPSKIPYVGKGSQAENSYQ